MTESIQKEFEAWYYTFMRDTYEIVVPCGCGNNNLGDLSTLLDLNSSLLFGVKEDFFDHYNINMRIERVKVQSGLYKDQDMFIGKVGGVRVGMDSVNIGATAFFTTRNEVRQAVEKNACVTLEHMIKKGYVKSLIE